MLTAQATIQDLARTIEESCSRRVSSAPPLPPLPPLPTAWPPIDQALRGLPRAAIHEWFNSDAFSPKGWSSIAGGCRDSDTPGKRTNAPPATGGAAPRQPPAIDDQPFGLKDHSRSFTVRPATSRSHTLPWLPPLTPILHLARQAAASSPHPIVWIGRRVWPYPRVCPDLLDRSIFIDAKDLSERAWATDVSLRCPALAAVIADGTAFTMSATRRLQLAASDSGGIGLILRPPNELRQLSAAHTRWLVSPAPSPTAPRWTLRLLRCKGTKLPDITAWTLELNHETGALDLVPPAPHRSVPPQEIPGAVTA